MTLDSQRTYTFQTELFDRAGAVVTILEWEYVDRLSIDGLPDRFTLAGVDYFLNAMATKKNGLPVQAGDPVTVEAAYTARYQVR